MLLQRSNHHHHSSSPSNITITLLLLRALFSPLLVRSLLLSSSRYRLRLCNFHPSHTLPEEDLPTQTPSSFPFTSSIATNCLIHHTSFILICLSEQSLRSSFRSELTACRSELVTHQLRSFSQRTFLSTTSAITRYVCFPLTSLPFFALTHHLPPPSPIFTPSSVVTTHSKQPFLAYINLFLFHNLTTFSSIHSTLPSPIPSSSINLLQHLSSYHLLFISTHIFNQHH